MEMGEKVVLAPRILKVEAIHHEIGAIDPFDVLNLLCHVCICAEGAVQILGKVQRLA